MQRLPASNERVQKHLPKGPPGNERVQEYLLRGPPDNERAQKHLLGAKTIRLLAIPGLERPIL